MNSKKRRTKRNRERKGGRERVTKRKDCHVINSVTNFCCVRFEAAFVVLIKLKREKGNDSQKEG